MLLDDIEVLQFLLSGSTRLGVSRNWISWSGISRSWVSWGRVSRSSRSVVVSVVVFPILLTITVVVISPLNLKIYNKFKFQSTLFTHLNLIRQRIMLLPLCGNGCPLTVRNGKCSEQHFRGCNQIRIRYLLDCWRIGRNRRISEVELPSRRPQQQEKPKPAK